MNDFCTNIFTIPQFTGTCWFNSLLMALFYSELSRNFFLEHLEDVSNETKKKKKYFYKVIDHLLRRTYIKSEKQIDEFQNHLRPENILRNLHKVDAKIFYFDPKKQAGWMGEAYLPQLFQYMEMKEKVLIMNTSHNEQGLQMSLKNYPITAKNNKIFCTRTKCKIVEDMMEMNELTKNKNLVKKHVAIPDYVDFLVIERKNANTRMLEDLSLGNVIGAKQGLKEVLSFKNATFRLDSMLLSNFNISTCKKGHQISGVTCKGKRYLYNGWTRNTKDPSKKYSSTNNNNACDLFEFDWFAEANKKSFCINSSMCDYPDASIGTEKFNVCFDTSKGAKTYIYVRDRFADPKYTKYDNMADSPYTPFKSVTVNNNGKICPPDKILNPKTNRCVSRTGAIGRKLLLEEKDKTNDNHSSFDKCMQNHTVKQLKVIVDQLQQPKSLKTKRKSEICDAISHLMKE